MVSNNFKCNRLMPLHFKGFRKAGEVNQEVDPETRWCI